MGPFAPTVPLTSFHCVPIVTVPVVHSLNNSEVNRVNVNKGRERRESAHRTFPSFVHFSLSLHPSLTFSPLFANEGNEGRTVGESKSEGYGRVNQWEHWALLRSHCFPSSPVHFSLFPLVRLFRALTHSPRVNKRENTSDWNVWVNRRLGERTQEQYQERSELDSEWVGLPLTHTRSLPPNGLTARIAAQ